MPLAQQPIGKLRLEWPSPTMEDPTKWTHTERNNSNLVHKYLTRLTTLAMLQSPKRKSTSIMLDIRARVSPRVEKPMMFLKLAPKALSQSRGITLITTPPMPSSPTLALLLTHPSDPCLLPSHKIRMLHRFKATLSQVVRRRQPNKPCLPATIQSLENQLWRLTIK